MWLLLLPLKLRYMLWSAAIAGLAASAFAAWRYPDRILWLGLPLVFFGFFFNPRAARFLPATACDLAQLPDRGPSAFSLRKDPAGDAPVFFRGRQGRPAVPAGQAGYRLSTRQRCPRQAPVRHPVRRLPAAL